MTDQTSAIGSNNENQNHCSRKDIEQNLEAHDICILSSTSLSVDKSKKKQQDNLNDFNIDDSTHQYFNQSIDSKLSNIIQREVELSVQRGLAEMKEILLRSMNPTERQPLLSSSIEEIDTTKLPRNGLKSGSRHCASLLATLKIPEKMPLSKEEADVATYIFNVDGWEDELIVQHCAMDASRKIFYPLIPGTKIDSDVLTLVALKCTHDQRSCHGGQTIWFLPPHVSQLALSWTVDPRKIVLDFDAIYLSPVAKLSKVYFPINDDNRHWYLLCVDLRKKKLIYLDSLYSKARKIFRERQIRHLAVFLEEMIEWKRSLDKINKESAKTKEVEYFTSGYDIHHPRNLPQQAATSVDCGIWVARWRIYSDIKNSFNVTPVDNESRMRLALDLVLNDYNGRKFETVCSAKKFVKEKGL